MTMQMNLVQTQSKSPPIAMQFKRSIRKVNSLRLEMTPSPIAIYLSQIKKSLEKGCIEPNSSPYKFPILFVKRGGSAPNGSWLSCT